MEKKIIKRVMLCACAGLFFGGLFPTQGRAEESGNQRSYAAVNRSFELERAKPDKLYAEIDLEHIVELLEAGGVVSALDKSSAELSEMSTGIHDSFRHLTVESLEAFSGGKLVSGKTSADVGGEAVFEVGDFTGSVSSDHYKFRISHKTRSFRSIESNKRISKDAARKIAVESIAKLGIELPFSQWWKPTTLVATTGGASRSELGEKERTRALAYKVFGRSTIGGVPILEAKYVVSVFLDGSVHKVAIREPVFKIVPGSFVQLRAQDVAKKIQKTLREYPVSSSWKELKLHPVFSVRNGILERGVLVVGPLHYPGLSPAGQDEKTVVGRMSSVLVSLEDSG